MPCGLSGFKMPLLLLFIACFCATKVSAAEKLILKDQHQWPAKYSHINGNAGDTKDIVFSSAKVTVDQQLISSPKISIDKQTIVYVPKNAKIQALPKAYTAPALGKEVKRYYTEGLGSYALWALLIGLAGLSR